MTKHDLKELAAMGAELGAAKAENDRLRGLLRELREITSEYAWDADLEARVDAALSHQSEPTATYTAVDMATAAAQGFRDGQAAVEQAAAQDETEPAYQFQWREIGEGDWIACSHSWFRFCEASPERDTRVVEVTRTAQTEQQPPYPHEEMDVIATSRYQVVASGSGPLSRYYVRAGDGKCELYRGGKSDCEHVARKLEGAFLDGGLTAFGLYAAPARALELVPMAAKEESL